MRIYILSAQRSLLTNSFLKSSFGLRQIHCSLLPMSSRQLSAGERDVIRINRERLDAYEKGKTNHFNMLTGASAVAHVMKVSQFHSQM